MTCVRIGLTALLLALPSLVLAADDPFAEFRIPDHSWRTLSGDLSGFTRRLDTSSGRYEGELTESTGRLASTSSWNRYSERIEVQHRVGASADEEWSTSQDRRDYIWLGSDRDLQIARRKREAGIARAYASTDWTIHPDAFGWSPRMSARVDGAWQRSRDIRDGYEFRSDASTRTTFVDERGIEQRLDQYAARVEVGVARGRVRGVTGVFTARLLLERLRVDGRLEREPSPSTARELAELFYLSDAFSAAHELPQKFFWREVERVLKEDGALGTAGFDAFDLLHGLDPLVVASGRFMRYAGWQGGPLLQYEHAHEILHRTDWQVFTITRDDTLIQFENSFRGAGRSSSSDDNVIAGAFAEWHRPMGLRTQLDLSGDASFAVGGSDERTEIRSAASIGHLVGERWFLAASARHLRLVGTGTEPADLWQTTAELSARYFLEDRWSLSLALSQFQYRPGPSGFNSTFQRENRLEIGLGYRRGAFDAPGLIDPVRPLN